MNLVLTEEQISAGGVAYRAGKSGVEVALILVAPRGQARLRWQLPKGLVNRGEELEAAARREVREETGLETEALALIETAEYWYFGSSRGVRVRFHKLVHFYLLRFVAGDTSDHDHEVREARWIKIDEAEKMLAFAGERKIIARAREMIAGIVEE